MFDYSLILAPILAHYTLPITRHEYLRTSENTVVKLTTANGTPYALRIRKITDAYRRQIASELRILHDFRTATHAEIPAPQPTRHDEFYCIEELNGDAYMGIVFSWVPGIHLAPDKITDRHIMAMARATARLHRFSNTYAPPSDLVRPTYDDEWFFGRNAWAENGDFLRRLERDNARQLREVNDRIRDAFRRIPTDSAAFGLIHYDLHVGNFLFQQEQANMIDFDECGFGHYLFDLAHILFEFIGHPDFNAFLTAATASYAVERAAADGTCGDLNLFLALQGIAYLNWLNRILLRDGNTDAMNYWIPIITQRLNAVLNV